MGVVVVKIGKHLGKRVPHLVWRGDGNKIVALLGIELQSYNPLVVTLLTELYRLVTDWDRQSVEARNVIYTKFWFKSSLVEGDQLENYIEYNIKMDSRLNFLALH
jgi:hypothetical protein